MKLFERMLECMVVILFAVMFIGYSIFVYPFEIINTKVNPTVKQKQIKHAPQL
jgi:hypothetical protein